MEGTMKNLSIIKKAIQNENYLIYAINSIAIKLANELIREKYGDIIGKNDLN